MRRIFTIFVLTVLLLAAFGMIISFGAAAQEGETETTYVHGEVQVDGELMPSVQVKLVHDDGTTLTATTDGDGYYLIENVPLGSHYVQCEYDGWLKRDYNSLANVWNEGLSNFYYYFGDVTGQTRVNNENTPEITVELQEWVTWDEEWVVQDTQGSDEAGNFILKNVESDAFIKVVGYYLNYTAEEDAVDTSPPANEIVINFYVDDPVADDDDVIDDDVAADDDIAPDDDVVDDDVAPGDDDVAGDDDVVGQGEEQKEKSGVCCSSAIIAVPAGLAVLFALGAPLIVAKRRK